MSENRESDPSTGREDRPSLAALKGEYTKGATAELLSDLVDARTFPHVHKDQPLDLVLERMGSAGLELLTVISRADINKLEGIIILRDVLDSYGFGPVAQPDESMAAIGP